MELRLTILILVPLGLLAAALYRYAIRPTWNRTVERCEDLDARDAEAKRQREEAEQELLGHDPR